MSNISQECVVPDRYLTSIHKKDLEELTLLYLNKVLEIEQLDRRINASIDHVDDAAYVQKMEDLLELKKFHQGRLKKIRCVQDAKKAIRKMKSEKNSATYSEVNKRRCDEATLTGPAKKVRMSNSFHPKAVMFTNLKDENLECIVHKLGSQTMDSDGDVLVTTHITRTAKTLLAISQRIPIVYPQWLEDSSKSDCFLDPFNYLVKDVKAEEKYNFVLKDVINEKRNFLSGWTVYITPSIVPDSHKVKEFVKCNGGNSIICLTESQCRNVKSKYMHFTVSSEKDEELLKYLPTPHVSVEAILSGIIRQKLELHQYALFQN